ncbi:MAG: TIGR03936 family radical SAM-associated protein [Acidimicrobiales bacterium]
MRARLRFTKLGKLAWTSHRDLVRAWERAFRRVRLPVAWSGGFSPRPKVSFGLALPTGSQSLAEYLDVELTGPSAVEMDLSAVGTSLSGALPAGMDVTAAAVVDHDEESLQQAVTSCGWTMGLGDVPDAAELVAAAMAADSLVVTRNRKGHPVVDDIRPAIRSLSLVVPEVTGSGGFGRDETVLSCELTTQPRGLRPAELVAALGSELEVCWLRRDIQWIERDGARREPLPLSATAAPPHGSSLCAVRRDHPDDGPLAPPDGGVDWGGGGIAPNVAAPNVAAPDVAAPDVAAPDVAAPNVAAPDTPALRLA